MRIRTRESCFKLRYGRDSGRRDRSRRGRRRATPCLSGAPLHVPALPHDNRRRTRDRASHQRRRAGSRSGALAARPAQGFGARPGSALCAGNGARVWQPPAALAVAILATQRHAPVVVRSVAMPDVAAVAALGTQTMPQREHRAESLAFTQRASRSCDDNIRGEARRTGQTDAMHGRQALRPGIARCGPLRCGDASALDLGTVPGEAYGATELGPMAERPFIYRFSTDLRLDDHAGLAAAASRGGVLPTIVIDDALASRLKASPRRAAFFCSAVAALAAELREMGSRLVVRRGPPGKIIAELARADRRGRGGVERLVSTRRGSMTTGACNPSWKRPVLPRWSCTTLRRFRPRRAPRHAVRTAPATARSRRTSSAGGSSRIASYENPLLLRFHRERSRRRSVAATSRSSGRSEDGTAASPQAARMLLERFLEDRAAQYGAASRDSVRERNVATLRAHILRNDLGANDRAQSARTARRSVFAQRRARSR